MSRIAIVGGGPAGLALALRLDETQTPYTLFESTRIGSTWAAAPPGLIVLSPWWTNVIRWRDIPFFAPWRKPPASEYLRYLESIRARLKGEVHEGACVEHIDRADGAWTLRTASGQESEFKKVVLATGYFRRPRGPTPAFTSDNSIPVIHASELRDYGELAQFAEKQDPVLVVGRRVTAGQLLLALDDRGITTALSTRSPLAYRRHGAIASLREAMYYIWEELQSHLKPGIVRNSYPVMEGGRTRVLIESGRIPIYGPVSAVRNQVVEFSDGTISSFSAVLLATGYDPALELMDPITQRDEQGLPAMSGFEVVDAPGVYLLGFDNLFDHRSRYLRGIRADALRLAKTLS